jgi:hypothetical protein
MENEITHIRKWSFAGKHTLDEKRVKWKMRKE